MVLATFQEGAAPPNPSGPGPLAGLRVLVVDDNRDAADSLGELLAVYGADARVFHDPVLALDAAEGCGFDAAVLDVHMPGMDGCALAVRLRAAAGPRRVVLVALTGVGDEAARRRTAAAGFDLHLTKGAAADALLAPLAAFARWRREHGG